MAAVLRAVDIDSVKDETQHVRASMNQAGIGLQYGLARRILPDYQYDAIDHRGQTRLCHWHSLQERNRRRRSRIRLAMFQQAAH